MIRAMLDMLKTHRQMALRRIADTQMRADILAAESRTGLTGAWREAHRRTGGGRGQEARRWRRASEELVRRMRL